MAKATISRELANKYKEFEGRTGETVEASEIQSVVAKHAKDKPSDTAASRPSPSALDAASAPATPARTARKTAAKSAAKKTAKRTR